VRHCHVPFKKTDLFHGVASLPSRCPEVLRRQRAGSRGSESQLLRDNLLFPGDALQQLAVPTTSNLLLDDVAATAPAGSNGVIFTPWLNGERTRSTTTAYAAGWHDLSLADDARRPRPRRPRRCGLQQPVLLEVVEKFTGRPSRGSTSRRPRAATGCCRPHLRGRARTRSARVVCSDRSCHPPRKRWSSTGVRSPFSQGVKITPLLPAGAVAATSSSNK